MTTEPKTRLTYEEAAAQCRLGYSAWSLRRFASDSTPRRRKLRTVRLSHKKVLIRIHDLRDWEHRMEGGV